MIKVLHFVSTPSIGSGVMSVIMNYYRHMDRSKIQFDFLCFIPCEDSYEKEINELGGQVFFVRKPGSSIFSLYELNRFFVRHKNEYCSLHNHEVYLSFLLKPFSKKYKIPTFIVHCHATNYSDKKLSSVRNAILCIPIRFLNCKRLACSKAAGIFLYGKKLVKQGKVMIIPNAIDPIKYDFNLQKRNYWRKQFGFSSNEIILGHIGRFNYQKNHQYLFKIFKEMQNYSVPSRLICIGDGPLKTKLESQVEELMLNKKVIFTGQRSDVAELLNCMDYFLLPSHFEGFPVSLVEARYNGLPCFISDAVADEFPTNGITRLSIKGSPDIWARKISQYPNKRIPITTNYEEYSIYHQAKKLEEIYYEKKTN